MRTIYTNYAKSFTALILITMAAILAGCGASGSSASKGTSGTTTTSAGGSMTIGLYNGAGTAITSISSASPAVVRATLLDTAGIAVPNAVVAFTTESSMGTMTPVNGTALTDASGVASIILTPASVSAAGAATITASATIGTSTVTGSTGYSIGAAAITMSTITLGTGTTVGTSLSAFGTTSVSVSLSSGGVAITTPQVVTFTSTCAGTGTAVLTSSVTTVNGVATGSYRDNGCGGTDLITASVSGLSTSQTATIHITPATAGSVKFVSATPAIISLAGTGGTSSSIVKFQVVDSNNQGLSGKVVTLNLSTTLGGIYLSPAAPATATSDSSGYVQVTVNAGTISTPARVTASTCTTGDNPCTGTVLTTQSNLLSITTGIPAQSSFSLSATTLNIEGWDYDGVNTTLTVRLADHFSNFPPDGTAVNFISEGARVDASCVTESGNCTVVFNSQAIRPSDGRVSVLAYAVGEESFVDTNGNGVADKVPGGSFGPELIDILGLSTDMPEAWVDYSENGVRDVTEPYIDFNNSGTYDVADGNYNGVLCTALSSTGTCSTTKSIHVRQNIVIVLSGSNPVITTNLGTLASVTGSTLDLDLDPATGALTSTGGSGCGAPQTIRVKIVDLHGNLMPAGTTVAFATSGDGKITWTSGSFPVENANTPIASIPAYNYSVTIQGDGSKSAGVCTDTTPNGALTVTIKTPKGVTTSAIIANLKN